MRFPSLLGYSGVSGSLLLALLRPERRFIGIKLGLFAKINPVLRRGGIDIVKRALVCNGRDSAWWQHADYLVLLWRCNCFRSKARLGKQHLFLRRGDCAVIGATRLAACH